MTLSTLVYKLNRCTCKTFWDILELISKVNAERVLFLIKPLPEIPIDFLWERAILIERGLVTRRVFYVFWNTFASIDFYMYINHITNFSCYTVVPFPIDFLWE